MRIIKIIRQFEQKIDLKAEQFFWKHPLFGFFSIFVGIPIFVLACVCLSTIVIVFPMVWLFGWF